MQPRPDERQLILQAQQGDKNAVGALYDAYVQAIYRYVSYRVESDQVAQDLTAEVFLRMVQGLPRFKDSGAPLGAWLFRIAATQIADHYRQRHRVTAAQLSDNQLSEGTDPFGSLEDEEERAQLRQALGSLPEEYQTLLILRFMQQLPHNEVAAILKKSEPAIRVMQHRALKALAKALGQSSKARSYLRGEEA